MNKTLKINAMIILCFILSSCSMVTSKKQQGSKEENLQEKQELEVPTQLEPETVANKPGEVRLLSAEFSPDAKQAQFLCNQKSIPSFKIENVFYAFIAETYFSQLKDKECIALADNGQSKKFRVDVIEKEFPSEKLNVDRKRVFLSKKDLARVRKERVFKDKVYASSNETPYFSDSFRYPIDSIVTSIYGSKRLFNNKKQTQHLGTDYRAGVGEEIYSSNRGRVVMARDLFYTGNTVVIDHGVNVFTVYAHMSELKVREGDMVKKGDLIGLAGSTGRVTGPHLHWGILVNGLAIEGDSLVSESQKISL